MPRLTYIDPRSFDTYDIFLTEDLEFDFCRRHVCGIGTRPFEYQSLSEVPQPSRNMIEHRIIEFQKSYRP